ncbi:MAG TPA: PQQ-binding-like beta-propeller repeat protein [Pilimelia sp.]|nr:PQQ-binding-like beta-propeller repeat protein [Pilimelia sp.]
MVNSARAALTAALLTATAAATSGQPAAGQDAAGQPAAATRPGDAWAHPGAHPTGDHYNAGESRLTAANAAALRRRWSVPLAKAVCADPAPPLVAAGRLVTAAAYRISAYDAASGALRWRTPDRGKRRITLAAAVGDTLVAQWTDCRSGRDHLTAVHLPTGRTRYTRQLPEVLHTTVVDAGVLLGEYWDAGASRYALAARRISDGSLLWTRSPGSFNGSPVSARGRVRFSTATAASAVHDIRTGRLLWRTPPGCPTPRGAAPDGGHLYLTCTDGRILRVDAGTGALGATFPGPEEPHGFASDGRRVYQRGFGPDRLIAVDARTGAPVWSVPNADVHDLAVAGGVVYGARTGRPPLAVVAATGERIRLAAPLAAVTGQPMVAYGRLYAVTGAEVTAYAP